MSLPRPEKFIPQKAILGSKTFPSIKNYKDKDFPSAKPILGSMTFWGPELSQICAKSAESGFCDFAKVISFLLFLAKFGTYPAGSPEDRVTASFALHS